jgi:hypothetical protein
MLLMRCCLIPLATVERTEQMNRQIHLQIISLGMDRGIAVGIATAYGLENRGVGVRIAVGSRIFTFSCRPWGPPNLLSNGGYLPKDLNGKGVKLTTLLQLVLRERKRVSTHPFHQTSSWHSAYFIKHRNKFTLPFYFVGVIIPSDFYGSNVVE